MSLGPERWKADWDDIGAMTRIADDIELTNPSIASKLTRLQLGD